MASEPVLTTDGPLAETREVLTGYYLIDVDDLDQACTGPPGCRRSGPWSCGLPPR